MGSSFKAAAADAGGFTPPNLITKLAKTVPTDTPANVPTTFCKPLISLYLESRWQNMFICAPHVSQVAALAALECIDEMEANRAVYAENRRLMLEGLPRAGFDKIAPPDGAFYIYPDVSEFTEDSLGFARDILHKAGVAVTPGLDFDPLRGGLTLRFSYARGTADIVEGLERLAAYMAQR